LTNGLLPPAPGSMISLSAAPEALFDAAAA
jgi:hypothetical protein